jgi:hypothetical protein
LVEINSTVPSTEILLLLKNYPLLEALAPEVIELPHGD